MRNHFYTYRITFVDGDYYYGSRECEVHPQEDIYWGSPKTHKDKWRTTMFSKTILNVFETSKEMMKGETKLIKPVYRTDPHCLNENCAGRINMTPEIRQKISDSHKGIKKGAPSEETKRKISEAKKGKSNSEEHNRKISEVRKGRTSNRKGAVHTDESKRKMSEARKGKPKSEETKRKMREAWIKRRTSMKSQNLVLQTQPL